MGGGEVGDEEPARVADETPVVEELAFEPSIVRSAAACVCRVETLDGEDAEPLDDDPAAELEHAVRACGVPSDRDPGTTLDVEHGARSQRHRAIMGTCKTGGARAGRGGAAGLATGCEAKGKTDSWNCT